MTNAEHCENCDRPAGPEGSDERVDYWDHVEDADGHMALICPACLIGGTFGLRFMVLMQSAQAKDLALGSSADGTGPYTLSAGDDEIVFETNQPGLDGLDDIGTYLVAHDER